MSTTTTESKTPITDKFKALGVDMAPISIVESAEIKLAAAQAEILGLREALQQVLYGIGNTDNSMSRENMQIIDSIGNLCEAALTSPPPPVVPASALQDERDHSEMLADAVKHYQDICPADPDLTTEFYAAGLTLEKALAAHEARKQQ